MIQEKSYEDGGKIAKTRIFNFFMLFHNCDLYQNCHPGKVLSEITSTVPLSPNEDIDFFSQSVKYYETQKAYMKTKFCFSNQQSIGLPGASCYLCQ